MNTITLLNPFSVSLKKPPFMEIEDKPVYENGDYRIYKNYERHFIHTFKNIVFAERGAPNEELINILLNDIKPTNEADLFHQYEWPKEAIQNGIKAAKTLNFKIK